MVDALTGETLSLKVVNLSPINARNLIIQAGSFAENRFDSVVITTEDGKSQQHDVSSQWLSLDLAPGCGASLEFTYTRYVNSPTYETPFSARQDWDPIITGRNQ